MSEHFDDFLSLKNRDFSSHRLLVFHGVSGSGKSTAIAWLLMHHPCFAGKSVLRLHGPPFAGTPATRDVVVVDELRRMRDLVVVWRLMRRSSCVLVASHLPPICIAPLRTCGLIATFATDRSVGKIERALMRRGIASTPAAVEHFVSRYGANYTDLDIVLEHGAGQHFDEILARFEKLHVVRRTPAMQCTSS